MILSKSKTTLSQHRERGIGLIEVLVAVLVSSIGLIGLIALQAQTMRATQDTYNRSHAIWVFNDVVNRILANEYYAAEYAIENFQCVERPEAICNTLSINNLTEEPENLCSPQEFAFYELWEAVCPRTQNNSTYFSSSDYILNPTLSISCVEEGCPARNKAMSVTLSWTTKINESDTSSISEIIYP